LARATPSRGLGEEPELEQVFHDNSLRSRSWESLMVAGCEMALRVGEEQEGEREKWGMMVTLRAWFDCHRTGVEEVPPGLILNGDEVGPRSSSGGGRYVYPDAACSG
jgi:hypothetical protein